jgi:MipA family protein
MRFRAEIRQGIRAHSGVVADLSADAFYDLRPDVRISGGPRASFASAPYFKSYFGVNAAQSAASGLGVYAPNSGIRAIGLGGAVTWKTTEKLTTSLFGDYSRLVGSAADSTLVKQRGSENQFTIGVSATYRFDFSM